jgi:hypothetical protein
VKTLGLIACLVGLALLVTLGSSRAQAQAEIDPDHYETVDAIAKPLPQSKAVTPRPVGKINCEGDFLLTSSVRCNTSSLPPGKYLISVNSEGRTVRITLNRREAEGIIQAQNRNRRRNTAISVAEKKTP